MNEFLKTQSMIFIFSCLLGANLGLLYDCFRLIRMIINPRNIFIFAQDIIYFFVSAMVTFLFVLVLNNGESRFYILAGEGIGWIAYHLTFGEFIYRYSQKIVVRLNAYINKINSRAKKVMSKIHKINLLKFVKK